MIIIRTKKFAEEQQSELRGMTVKDMQMEQFKLQRQQRLIQHQKNQLQIKEDMAKAKALTQQQKLEQEKDEAEDKDRIRIKQQERLANEGKKDNTNLYKTKSKITAPVSMPK